MIIDTSELSILISVIITLTFTESHGVRKNSESQNLSEYSLSKLQIPSGMQLKQFFKAYVMTWLLFEEDKTNFCWGFDKKVCFGCAWLFIVGMMIDTLRLNSLVLLSMTLTFVQGHNHQSFCSGQFYDWKEVLKVWYIWTAWKFALLDYQWVCSEQPYEFIDMIKLNYLTKMYRLCVSGRKTALLFDSEEEQ